jgi:hypothetical protein
MQLMMGAVPDANFLAIGPETGASKEEAVKMVTRAPQNYTPFVFDYCVVAVGGSSPLRRAGA